MIIHTTNGTHAFRLPFYSVTDHLDDSRFLQCNRGIMLNMDYIRTMESDYFEMTDSKVFSDQNERTQANPRAIYQIPVFET